MKPKAFLYLSILIFFTLLSGCENEGVSSEDAITDPLHDTWDLINTNNGWGSNDYAVGQAKWIIDTENMTITTYNSIYPEYTDPLSNGVFNYIISIDENENRVLTWVVEYDDNGNISYTRDIGVIAQLDEVNLILDPNLIGGIGDGVVWTFIRQE